MRVNKKVFLALIGLQKKLLKNISLREGSREQGAGEVGNAERVTDWVLWKKREVIARQKLWISNP